MLTLVLGVGVFSLLPIFICSQTEIYPVQISMESGHAIGAFLLTPALLDKISGLMGARFLCSAGLGSGDLRKSTVPLRAQPWIKIGLRFTGLPKVLWAIPALRELCGIRDFWSARPGLSFGHIYGRKKKQMHCCVSTSQPRDEGRSMLNRR